MFAPLSLSTRVCSTVRLFLFGGEEVLTYFVQLCLALQHIHSKNIIHRDLKEENIFVTPTGCVKVGDFGASAIAEGPGGQADGTIGSIHIMSPQILLHVPYDKSTDIWSLGCILYRLVRLRRPFDFLTPAEMLAAMRRHQLKPIPKYGWGTWSADILALVDALLQFDPADRPTIEQILALPFIKAHVNKILPRLQADVDTNTLNNPHSALDEWKTPGVIRAPLKMQMQMVQHASVLLAVAEKALDYGMGVGGAGQKRQLTEGRREDSLLYLEKKNKDGQRSGESAAEEYKKRDEGQRFMAQL